MAIPSREAIETFMSVTGASEGVAVRELQEHLCNLNEALNSHFNEPSRNINGTSVGAPVNDFMDIDGPILNGVQRDPFSHPFASRNFNPFTPLAPSYNGGLLDQSFDFINRAPFVSHPRVVREIPVQIKNKDKDKPCSQSSVPSNFDDKDATVIIDDDFDEPAQLNNGKFGGPSHVEHPRPKPNAPKFEDIPFSAPEFHDLHDYGDNVEAEMIQAAIEASKREVENGYHNNHLGTLNDTSAVVSSPRQSLVDDADFAEAVSLSLKTAQQEKAQREHVGKDPVLDPYSLKSTQIKESGKSVPTNRRFGIGSSSIQDEAEDFEEKPLVRNRSKHISSDNSLRSSKDVGPVEFTEPLASSAVEEDAVLEANENNFQSDEWGGMSSVEHDEAVMLEAAMFGGIAEGSEYGLPYAPPHLFMPPSLNTSMSPYSHRPPRTSPSVEAQRLIREQQDDEYFASLQADREKELKVREEAEVQRSMEMAAREAAVEQERLKEAESRKKLEEEKEFERQLAAKESSLPEEPEIDDENAVTLLVRMPDGSRRGRRFLNSHKLQFLFDFIDTSRKIEAGSYRLVRPYPRRAFSSEESSLSFKDVGLSSKQEALFLESI